MGKKSINHALWFLSAVIILWLFGIYNFGYRVLFLGLTNIATAMFIEVLFYRRLKVTPNTIATAVVYTLVLPPGLPYFHTVLGMGFGYFFGKLIFGGPGYYIFSPVLVGRVFLHVSFPVEMSQWTRPVEGSFGGLTTYVGQSIEAITSATPLIRYGWGQTLTPLKDLVLGRTAGSIGEVSGLLIVCLGLVLIIKKIIPGSVVFSMIIMFSGMQFMSNMISLEVGLPLLHHLFSGGFLLGCFFIATEESLVPKGKLSRWVYGAFIGLIAFLIRHSDSSTEGVMFAILIGNMLSPFLDYLHNQTLAFVAKKGGERS